jgi:hypothetical protein
LDIESGDPERICSSLNTIAGTLMAAGNPTEGMKYALRAIEYAKQAGNPVSLAVVYGMASEIEYTLREDEKALCYADSACLIEATTGNTHKMMVRLSQKASILNGLVRPSCLIIDEVGHCEFDKENTRLFFDLIDRRYNKEGNYNIVFTSNKNPSLWRGNFNEDDSLLCALDRIFDDATVFTIKGQSFRGKKLETVALQTSGVKETPANT